MDTRPLKSFAVLARTELIREVIARVTAVLAHGSPERVERPQAVAGLERAIAGAGGGDQGRAHVADKVAYTWFNRIMALRFLDANGYTGIGVVSPAADQVGQPEVLAAAKRGQVDTTVVKAANAATITGLLNGTRQARPGVDAQSEAYELLLADYCRFWNAAMPFMFEREGDYTELLIPANLLADDSVLSRSVVVLSEEVCRDVEVIGWLYQFYISERKDEVFAGFKKNKKAGADEIPAATQLFTPHWIVRYLVENSLGRLWMLNRPTSALAGQMDYYIAPVEEETDFLTISKPEELKVMDPACGSGHMLTYAFDLLYAIYEEEGYTPSEIPGLILTHNLYGTEIDPRAGALAAFALTMKAAAKRKLFLKKPVEPNIRVLEPITFTPDELDYLVTMDGDRQAEGAFWNQFAHADTLGSLITPDPALTTRLARHLQTITDDGDMYKADALDWAQQAIRQAQMLSATYSVVVANPPYMGTGSMDTLLSQFVKDIYPSGKSDLFACFILRCLELCQPFGRVAMITMHSWMFLSSYAKLRAHVSRDHRVESLAHLGTGAFDTIGGEVVSTAAFVIQAGVSRAGATGTYVRLVKGPNETAKATALCAAAAGDPRHVYRVANADMAALPGCVIAYWMSPALLHAMTENTLLGQVSEPRCGMNTGDNGRFVRNWWEVDRNRSYYDAESTASAHSSGRKWFPYNKGGTFRKWYGNQQSVVAFDATSYDILSKQGNHLPSRQFYFHPAVSWSKVAGSAPSFRYFPPGFVFDGAGMSLFTERHDQRLALLGLLNSKVSLAALEAIAPTLNFQSGDIARLPLPKNFDAAAAAGIVRELVDAAKADWDQQEVSWNFARDPLVDECSSTSRTPLRAIADALLASQDDLVEIQRQLEEANNATFIDAFEMRGELSPEAQISAVTLFSNATYRYGATRAGKDALRRADAITNLVSYAIGCMFGRYSLDMPGLVLADQGATLQDYLVKVPTPTFIPDADNVIPIVDGDWFEDDVVGLFRGFLRAAFGDQHFEENLTFVTESLGVKNLRDYFITRAGKSKFYDDHVQRYKKRPIYWLFSSPKGSFNALIYMHRYTPSTVSTVLTYLREYVTKLESALQQAERAGNAKEADRVRKVLLELNEYEHDTLYPKASENLAIDLDDGVKTNYPKFGAALRKIAGLEASGE